MKYRLATWIVPLPFLATAASPPGDAGSQVREALQIGGETYRFHAEKLILSTSSPQAKGKRFLRMQGCFLPGAGEPIRAEMTLVEDGRIYLLKMARKRGANQSEDLWAATMKTRIEVLELQAKVGGKLRLRLSGPLAATLKEGGSLSSWSGEIQAVFDGVSD